MLLRNEGQYRKHIMWKSGKTNSHLQLDDNLTKSNTTGKQYSSILEERNYHQVFDIANIIHSIRPNFS